MGLAGHELHALIEACIAQGNGGVASVEQLVDGFPLLQPGQSAILPEDGGGVGQGALQPLVAAAQGLVTQLQPLLKDVPELVHAAPGGKGHIGQVDGDHALVKTAIVLTLAGNIVARVGNIACAGLSKAVGSKEGAAAHAGVDVPLQLQHLLLGNVVGDHPLGGALGGQLGEVVVGGVVGNVVFLQHIDELGEGGSDPHASLVLHTLAALLQGLLNDEGQVTLLLLVFGLVRYI